MVNTKLILKQIKKAGIDQAFISERMRIAQSTLSLKINNQRAFTIAEMFKLSELLDIPDEDLKRFFLA